MSDAGMTREQEDHRDAAPQAVPVLDENLQAIRAWEKAALHARSRAELLGDWITWLAASGAVLLGHLGFFTFWILANLDRIPGVTPFDHFPFPLLTLMVSLEAIFLSLFVIASQNRLATQSDKRAHLDLQINLLAEREMTAVLQLLRDIATHLEVPTRVTAGQLRDLAKKTDVHELTDKLDEFHVDGSVVTEPPAKIDVPTE